MKKKKKQYVVILFEMYLKCYKIKKKSIFIFEEGGSGVLGRRSPDTDRILGGLPLDTGP